MYDKSMYLYERALNGKSNERMEEYTEQMNHTTHDAEMIISLCLLSKIIYCGTQNPPFLSLLQFSPAFNE